MEKHLEAKAQKLNANIEDLAAQFSNALIIPPDDEEALEKHGTVYAVYDYSGHVEVDTLLVTKIVHDVLHDTYFQSESSSPIQALEKAVVAVRDKVTSVSKTNGNSGGSGHDAEFNLLAAVLWGNVLYLVQYGKGGNYLMRQNVLKPIQANTEGNFTVASGVIKDKDVVFMATKPFLTDFPPEKLFSSTTPVAQSQLPPRASALVLKFLVEGDTPAGVPVENISQQQAPEGIKSIEFSAPASIADQPKPAPFEKENLPKKTQKKGFFDRIFKRKLKVKDSNKSKKIPTIAVVMLLLAILGVSVFFTYRGNQAQERNDRVLGAITQAQETLDTTSAKAQLTEGDIDSLGSVLGSLDSITSDPELEGHIKEDHQSQITTLKQELNAELDRAAGIEKANAQVFYDIKLVDSNAQPSSIAVLDDKLVVADSSTGTIYVSDISTAKFEAEPSTFSGVNSLTYSAGNVGFSDNEGYKIYDVVNGSLEESYEASGSAEGLSGITSTYLDFVYQLIDGQINKFTKSGEFLEESLWAQSSDFDNAKDFSINVGIYVLTADGSLVRYTSGERDDFSVSGLPSALNDPVQVIADADFENIYIADAGNARVVVLDSDGNFLRQIKAESEGSFSEMSGIGVSRDEQTLYVLSGTKIYELPL